MDLRGIANSVTNAVNENMAVTVTASTGSTVGTSANGYKQTPNYAAPVSGFAQLQALDGSDLKQIDGLNLQGVLRAIYLRGALAGVIRPNSKGGDIVTIAAPAPPMYVGTWLVVKVLEQWPLWAKCVINLQVPNA
jgi:hypothetical protein